MYTCACVVGTEVSTRMVSEYKSKLQIAESENTRLEGTVSTLQCMYTCINIPVMLAVQLLSDLCMPEGRAVVGGV